MRYHRYFLRIAVANICPRSSFAGARQVVRLLQLLLPCILLLGSLITAMPLRAATAIEVRYVPLTGVSVEQLVAGEPGRGLLLYYPAGRAPERPALVVHLQTGATDDAATAIVYDDQNGNGYVDVDLQQPVPVIKESRPTLMMTTEGKWWLRNDVPNYNLLVRISAPLCAMWGAGPGCGGVGYLDQLQPGTEAFAIRTKDPEQRGWPVWDLRHLVPNLAHMGAIQTSYAERTCAGDMPRAPSVSPMWPYVAVQGEFEQQPGTFQPPIVVDWERSRITAFAELVTVRSHRCSYALYSLSPIVFGEHNAANFESPFAFYDLSGRGTNSPNLIVRTERFAAYDPYSDGLDSHAQQGRVVPRDIETMRYSWRTAVGDGLWDYKIEVLGFHPYTATTSIADGLAQIDAPAYTELPQWVVGKSWPVVTFVDTVGMGYASSEGIYEWSPREVGIGYVLGWEDQPKTSAFSTLRVGMRGEYRYQSSHPPRLYLSPIDKRLHLLGAEGGLWRLSEDVVIRHHNLGGAYINGWTRERLTAPVIDPAAPLPASELEEALYAADGYLLYSGSGGAIVRRANYEPTLIELDPPVDHASWESFNQRLAAYTMQQRDPSDFKSWLHSFPGTTFTVAGGQISELRRTPNGFRFVLELPDGFQSQPDDFIKLPKGAHGAYIVTYDGNFRATPLQPPSLSATLGNLPTTALQTNQLEVTLRNAGGQDVPSATLELWSSSSELPETLVATQTVTLQAGVPQTKLIDWTVPMPGTWAITTTLRYMDGSAIVLDSSSVDVASAKAVDVTTIFDVSTAQQTLPLLVGGLVLFMVIAGSVFWRRCHNQAAGMSTSKPKPCHGAVCCKRWR